MHYEALKHSKIKILNQTLLTSLIVLIFLNKKHLFFFPKQPRLDVIMKENYVLLLVSPDGCILALSELCVGEIGSHSEPCVL